MVKEALSKTLHRKLVAAEGRIKTSFALIREDVDEMQGSVELMKKYLVKKDGEYEADRRKDDKVRAEFEKDVDSFTEKISQLKIALISVENIKKEVVMKRDLAQIEERVKTSFKNDVESYHGQVKNLRLDLMEALKRIKALESGCVREKKSGWFGKKGKEEVVE